MIIRTFNVIARRVLTTLAIGTAGISMLPVAHADAPAPAAAEAAPAVSPIKLVSGAIAVGVEAREPVGEGTSFDASVGGLYAWVKLKNVGEATTITMVWKQEGKKRMSVELPVGHSWGWKTWSKKGITARSAGSWTVDVLDADGALIGSLAFDVAGNPDVGSR